MAMSPRRQEKAHHVQEWDLGADNQRAACFGGSLGARAGSEHRDSSASALFPHGCFDQHLSEARGRKCMACH